MYADVDAVNEEIKQAGAWVFGGGLHPASTATVVREDGGEVLLTDGPFPETQGAARRLLDHRGRRPRRRARLGPQGDRRLRAPRSRCGPSRTSPSSSPRCRLPQPRSSRSSARSPARPSRTLVRLFGDIDVAEEAVQEAFLDRHRSAGRETGVPPNPGRLDRDDGQEPRDRPVPARGVAARPPGAGARSHCSRSRRGGRCNARRPDAGRPAWPHLHVLPPRARAERPGGADATPARRPPDPRDRARVPRSRADDGATPRAGEEEDQRRQHPVPRSPATPS